MRGLLVCFMFAVSALVAAEDSILSKIKRESFEYDLQKSEVEAKKLHDSWINPINMIYSDTKSDQYGLNQKSKSFKIVVDQPIFKSGGIYFAIKYADATREYTKLAVQENKKALILQAVDLLYSYKKSSLQIKKQRLLIENSRIDVIRKKEQYLAGLIDGSFLDQAILNKNMNEIVLLDLQSALEDIKKGFEDISDRNIEDLEPPRFKLIELNSFLKRNIAIRRASQEAMAKKYFSKMTVARYLPSLSVTASYNSQEISGSFFMPPGRESYKEYGFKITMPLFDINSFRNVESTKIDYLKAELAVMDFKRSQNNLYKNVIRKLRLLDKKIELTREDIKLYRSLLEDTKTLFLAGEKTEYDVKTLENSLKIKKIDLKIYDIEKQRAIVQLYKKVM